MRRDGVSFDTVVRGGDIDVLIADGLIADVAPGGELGDDAREVIDATGLHVLPGLIDAHVHLNDPGRADWEGFASGTRALAAGGFTCAVDMPIHSFPPTVHAAAVEAKLAAAQGITHVDFALWGGVVPGSVGRMDELAEAGVVGFAAFMASSGNDDFAACDDLTLFEAMSNAARLDLPVSVHAENALMVRELGRRAIAGGHTAMADFLASRPIAAELEAITSALALASEAGCALHIAHISCGSSAALVAEARAAGANVTCETCPHYLAFTAEDAERLGVLVKCTPPLRESDERDGLWRAVRLGTIDLITSDHSPAPPALRQGHAFSAWSGIAGCQTTARTLLAEGLTPGELARLCAAGPAMRLGLPGGRVEPGASADLLLLDPGRESVLSAGDLYYRHQQSPYVGRALRGRIARTLLRGRTIAIDGRPVGGAVGQHVRPLSSVGLE